MQFFNETTEPKFTDEDSFLFGDQACVRWRFTWTSDDDPKATSLESTSFGSATGSCRRNSPTSRAERCPAEPLDLKDR